MKRKSMALTLWLIANTAVADNAVFNALEGLKEANPPGLSTKGGATGGTGASKGLPYETPASVACLYGLVAQESACNPSQVTAVATGGGHAVAVVVAYHYRQALADLQAFSAQFGLPEPQLSVVYADGKQPKRDTGSWALKAAVNLQWIHALAPNAALYLVEAASGRRGDMMAAVDKASAVVAAAGGGQVVMSWGVPEYAGQKRLDKHFTAASVTYLSHAGNTPGVWHPCSSPSVVCVGGTTLRRDPDSGAALGEVAWLDGGGGLSQFYRRPAYQQPWAAALDGHRGVPDVAAVADVVEGGAWVYFTGIGGNGWKGVSGGSWAVSIMAGILNATGHLYPSSQVTLENLYQNTSGLAFRDMTDGWCGFNAGTNATAGWDSCTGLGVIGHPTATMP